MSHANDPTPHERGPGPQQDLEARLNYESRPPNSASRPEGSPHPFARGMATFAFLIVGFPVGLAIGAALLIWGLKVGESAMAAAALSDVVLGLTLLFFRRTRGVGIGLILSPAAGFLIILSTCGFRY